MSYYRAHVFFCTNQRENGSKCCNDAQATECCKHAKQWVKEHSLGGQGNVRVSSAGCMGRCAQGPVLVIYPEGVWYTYHSRADVDEILTRHIGLGERIERLLLKDNV